MDIGHSLTPEMEEYYYDKFKLRCYESYGTGFQDYFEEIMRTCDPDFVPVSAGGGDRGLDGVLLHGNTVFAVYCPERTTHITKSQLKTKMKKDFKKFQDNWPEKSTWVFVYGRFRYPDEIIELSQQLESDSAKRIELWNIEHLWRKVKTLELGEIAALLGPPLRIEEPLSVADTLAVLPLYQPEEYAEWDEGDETVTGTRWQVLDKQDQLAEYLHELADRIESRYMDACEVRSFASTDVMYRCHNPETANLPHLRIHKKKIRVRHQISCIHGDPSGFQFWVTLLEPVDDCIRLRLVMHRLRDGQSHTMERSLGVAEGVFLVRDFKKPTFYFKVLYNGDIDPPHEFLGDRTALVEEIPLKEGKHLIRLTVDIPPAEGTPERALQIIGSSTLDSMSYSADLISLDIGFTWDTLVVSFWVPRFPDPKGCIQACENCSLREVECFDTHYWPDTQCRDAMVPGEYGEAQAFLDSDELKDFCRIYEKGLIDTYADQRTPEEKTRSEEYWNKIAKNRRNLDKLAYNLELIGQMPRPSPREIQMEAIRLIDEIMMWARRGAEVYIDSPFIPSEMLLLTPRALSELKALLAGVTDD